jgi:hypothetical protein
LALADADNEHLGQPDHVHTVKKGIYVIHWTNRRNEKNSIIFLKKKEKEKEKN